jgi:hypothetical protein
MDPVLRLLLIGLAVVVTAGVIATWLAIRRPTRSLERRRRDEALSAATLYTPAPRQSPYGAPPLVDPCTEGLSEGDRVQAMRTLLMRGDTAAAASQLGDGFAPTQPQMDDEVLTTAPMAWKPTLPPDEADDWERQRAQRARKKAERSLSTS